MLGFEIDDPLVSRLAAFCEEEEVVSIFSAFYREHCKPFAAIDLRPADDDDDDHGDGDFVAELPHEAMDIFMRFEELFEGVVERFLACEGIDAREFCAHCDAVLNRRRRVDDGVSHALQIVLSTIDWRSFVRLMHGESIRQKRAAEDAEDMGLF